MTMAVPMLLYYSDPSNLIFITDGMLIRFDSQTTLNSACSILLEGLINQVMEMPIVQQVPQQNC